MGVLLYANAQLEGQRNVHTFVMFNGLLAIHASKLRIGDKQGSEPRGKQVHKAISQSKKQTRVKNTRKLTRGRMHEEQRAGTTVVYKQDELATGTL